MMQHWADHLDELVARLPFEVARMPASDPEADIVSRSAEGDTDPHRSCRRLNVRCGALRFVRLD
jgi:hypothetical protein